MHAAYRDEPQIGVKLALLLLLLSWSKKERSNQFNIHAKNIALVKISHSAASSSAVQIVQTMPESPPRNITPPPPGQIALQSMR